MSTLDPESTYHALTQSGVLADDAAQRQVVMRLEALHMALQDYQPQKGLLAGLLKSAPAPKSMYLWGGVGRGKTMLVDMFYKTAPTQKKRRLHFQQFMMQVHARIHAFRQEHQASAKSRNPVPYIAKMIASETTLLCLDELQVSDVADAMILSRLFTILLEQGTVVVITSNRPPEQLYQGGLQRDRFLKFVELVNAEMQVVELASREDYRLRQLKAMQQTYLTPLGEAADRGLNAAFEALTHATYPEKVALEVQGRMLEMEASQDVARASFKQLCEMPLGAADYQAIAQNFSTLILSDIPTLPPEKRNEAKRFVALIDALYDHKVKLICSAAASPQKLYPDGDGEFEFQRTVSRLMEMQSERYLSASHIV